MTDRVDRTYGHWKEPLALGVKGLSAGASIGLLGLLGVAVLVMTFAGPLRALVFLSVVALVYGPLLWRDRWGRSGYERASQAVRFARHRRRRGHMLHAGPLAYTPSTNCLLPGVAARIEAFDAYDAFGDAFVVLHHPRPGHVATVIECSVPGTDLIDVNTVDQWVAGWGVWLADLGQLPDVVAAQVVVDTCPDPGVRLRRAVEDRLVDDAPAFAIETMREAAATLAHTSYATTVRVTVTWVVTGKGRDGLNTTVLEMGRLLPELRAGLGSAHGGDARSLSEAELAAVIRAAYEPSAIPAIAESDDALGWDDCGPTVAVAKRNRYLHDGATSVVWSMGKAPAGVVRSSVLTRLLLPHREVGAKRITLLYRPHNVVEASQLVQRDVNAAAFRIDGRRRLRADDRAGLNAALATEQEQALGAGLVRFGMLVTATTWGGDADEAADLDRAVTIVEQLAAGSRVQLRRQWWAQESAFVAGLPLGLVLPAHVTPLGGK